MFTAHDFKFALIKSSETIFNKVPKDVQNIILQYISLQTCVDYFINAYSNQTVKMICGCIPVFNVSRFVCYNDEENTTIYIKTTDLMILCREYLWCLNDTDLGMICTHCMYDSWIKLKYQIKIEFECHKYNTYCIKDCYISLKTEDNIVLTRNTYFLEQLIMLVGFHVDDVYCMDS